MDLSTKTVTLPSAITDTITNKLPKAGGSMTGELIIADTGTLDIRMGTDKRVTWSGALGEIGSVAGFQATNTAGSALSSFGMRGTDLRFATGSEERVRITDTGVGVGTASPGKKLDVNGEARITTGLTITPATSSVYATDSSLSSYSANNGVYLNGHDSGWLRLNGDGTNRASIDLYGASYTNYNDEIHFKTGNVGSRLVISNDGNVGIGTNNPSDKLTVSGGHINLPTVNSYIKGNGHNVLQVDATRTYFYGGTNGMQFRTSDNSAELVNILDNGLLGLYRATADPTATAAGQMYFNTTSGAVKVYDGSAWDQIQALTPFSTVNTRYQPHTQVNTQGAGAPKITSYGAAAWSAYDGGSSGGTYFGGHDGHNGNGTDYPAYVAVYLGGRHAVNRLNLVLHSNHFGYFELQGSNNSGTGGSYDAGSWTSLPFITSNVSTQAQHAGGQYSGYSDGTVLTYQYNNDIAYSSYRLWIKDASQAGESLGTRYTGWATYYWELYRD
tara:strand:- start:678 stop:2177 length:1500 start_codon:yes stop_codon:yes gene_type:complete